MPRLLTYLLLAAAAVLATTPAAAQAGVATMRLEPSVTQGGKYNDIDIPIEVGVARYVARPGEANDVTVAYEGGDLLLSDPAGIEPGDGCHAIPPAQVRCRTGDQLSSLTLELGDGDDRADLGVARGGIEGARETTS